MSAAEPPMQQVACYRHGDRAAGVTCQRCERPVCVSCQHRASVGVHCPECVRSSGQRVHQPRTQRPSNSAVTYALIALNVAAFAYMVVEHGASIDSAGTAARDWAIFAPSIDVDGEWWRIFTSGFGHFGLFHIGVNVYSLYRIGPMLERAMGPAAFLVAYVVSMITGSFGALLLDPLSLTMGASGAIFGLLGLLVMAFVQRGVSLKDSGMVDTLLLNGFITLSGFVSLGGHLGGFVAGIVLGGLFFGFGRGAEPPLGRGPLGPALAGASLGIIVFGGCLWAAAQWANPLF